MNGDHPIRWVDPSVPCRAAAMYLQELRIDLDALEKGTKHHEATRTALADFLTANGISPREHGLEAAFTWAGSATTVPSGSPESRASPKHRSAKQLRLGLGQLLDYRHACTRPNRTVRAALVVEHEPSDLQWVGICAVVGVVLAWPDRFEAAFA